MKTEFEKIKIIFLILLSILLLSFLSLFTSTKYYTESNITQFLIDDTWTDVSSLHALICTKDKSNIEHHCTSPKQQISHKRYWEQSDFRFQQFKYKMKTETVVNFKNIALFIIILFIIITFLSFKIIKNFFRKILKYENRI
jgi:flagellar biosynthesis/type III secretory pathway M-ring protein FliF/YscJ